MTTLFGNKIKNLKATSDSIQTFPDTLRITMKYELVPRGKKRPQYTLANLSLETEALYSNKSLQRDLPSSLVYILL